MAQVPDASAAAMSAEAAAGDVVRDLKSQKAAARAEGAKRLCCPMHARCPDTCLFCQDELKRASKALKNEAAILKKSTSFCVACSNAV